MQRLREHDGDDDGLLCLVNGGGGSEAMGVVMVLSGCKRWWVFGIDLNCRLRIMGNWPW